MSRHAHVERRTGETQIALDLTHRRLRSCRDRNGTAVLRPHADAFCASQPHVNLTVKAEGDLAVDSHHTVEDVGITLGQAFAQALGDKRGIARYGHAYLPMDETLARVVVDFSGRPFLEYRLPASPGPAAGLMAGQGIFAATGRGVFARVQRARGLQPPRRNPLRTRRAPLSRRRCSRAWRKPWITPAGWTRVSPGVPSTKGSL